MLPWSIQPPAPVQPRARIVRRLAPMAAVAVLVGAMVLLASCSSPDKFAPACPQRALLSDAADLTRFGSGGHDLTDMVVDGRITAIRLACSTIERGTVQACLSVLMDVLRGPAAPARGLVVPYFIAVSEGDRVLDKQEYELAVNFPANTDKISVTGQEVTLNLPVTPQKSAEAYKIYVGFSVSPDELAYNRKRGAR